MARLQQQVFSYCINAVMSAHRGDLLSLDSNALFSFFLCPYPDSWVIIGVDTSPRDGFPNFSLPPLTNTLHAPMLGPPLTGRRRSSTTGVEAFELKRVASSGGCCLYLFVWMDGFF